VGNSRLLHQKCGSIENHLRCQLEPFLKKKNFVWLNSWVTWTIAFAKRLEGTRPTWHRRCLWPTQEPETLETLVAGVSRTDYQTHFQSINTSMFSVRLIDSKKSLYWVLFSSLNNFIIYFRDETFYLYYIETWKINLFLFCQFSELNGDYKLRSVQLEKDIAQNLTCFQGSQNTRITWFKVNDLIQN
jgi:hypothetical protein